MKITKIFALSLFIFTLSTGASYTDPYFHNLLLNDDQQFEFAIDVPANLEVKDVAAFARSQGYDVAGIDLHTRTVGVLTSDRGVEFLKANGLTGQRRTEIGALSGEAALDQRYLNPEEVEQKLKEIHAKYPTLTHLEVIGKSIEGRSIWALMVSTTPDPTSAAALSKANFLFDAMHHAREVMTPEVPLDAAEYLLSNYNSDSAVTKILSGWNIWMIPMLNVDGSNIVWTKNNMWRKNAHASGQTTHGVDINRNYPYGWNSCDGSSSDKKAQDYRGESPASEPETQALVGLAERIRPTAGISYHSYSELVLYPYGCKGAFTGEKEIYKLFAEDLAANIPGDMDPTKHYEAGTPWEILYSTDGDSDAYLQASYGTMSFVIEMNKVFQPDYRLRDPTVEKLRKAWLHLFDKMDQSLVDFEVIDSRTKKPIKATIEISTIEHINGERAFMTNEGGHYFKVLMPDSEYIVVAEAATDSRRARGIKFKTGNGRTHVKIEL